MTSGVKVPFTDIGAVEVAKDAVQLINLIAGVPERYSNVEVLEAKEIPALKTGLPEIWTFAPLATVIATTSCVATPGFLPPLKVPPEIFTVPLLTLMAGKPDLEEELPMVPLWIDIVPVEF